MKTIIFSFALMALGVGCGDDGGTQPATDANHNPHDAGVETPPDASCFTNPTTHDEIINACTFVQQIFKDSHPPLLEPDGTLPPLPP